MIVLDGDHWLVGVAQHLLRASGRMFQMQYSVYNALCWAVSDWKTAAPGLLDSKLAEVSFEAEFLGEIVKRLLTDGLLGSARQDTWSMVAQSLRSATRLMSVAAAPLCVPTSATLRTLQVQGVAGAAVLANAALDPASGAWFEEATVRMGVDTEHNSTVLSVLELLLGPEGMPGRFQVDNRNDPACACSNMLAEIMRTADAIAHLGNTLQTRPPAVQASRIIVALRSSMAPPPMLVWAEPSQSGGFEYLAMLGLKGAELYAAQFAVGWRSYSAFNTALPGASDVQARTYLAGWLAAAKLGAVAEVSVTGLHAIVAEALPALKSLTAVTLDGYAAEIGRVITGGRRADKDGYADPGALLQSTGYQHLRREATRFDTSPVDGLAAAEALISSQVSGFGRALVLATSADKFSKVDAVWGRLYTCKAYAAQAVAKVVCVDAAGQQDAAIASRFPPQIALNILRGALDHGPPGSANDLNVFNVIVLHNDRQLRPMGSSLQPLPQDKVFVDEKAYYEAVAALRLCWAAIGEDCTAAGGFDDFFGNKAKGVEHLLVRAWRFSEGSLERSSLLMMIDSLVALATQSRGVRRRAAIAGALHAEHDTPIWMEAGSDVEEAFKAITEELKRLEKEASKLLNAMRFGSFLPPPAGMPPPLLCSSSPPPSAPSEAGQSVTPLAQAGNLLASMMPPPPPSVFSGGADDTMSVWAPSQSAASHASYALTTQAGQHDAMSVASDPQHWDWESCKGCSISQVFGIDAGSRASEVQWDGSKACALTFDGRYIDASHCYGVVCAAQIAIPPNGDTNTWDWQWRSACVCATPDVCVFPHVRPASLPASKYTAAGKGKKGGGGGKGDGGGGGGRGDGGGGRGGNGRGGGGRGGGRGGQGSKGGKGKQGKGKGGKGGKGKLAGIKKPGQGRALAPAELAELRGPMGLGRTGYSVGVDPVAFASPREAVRRFITEPPIILLIGFPSDEPGTLPTVLRSAGSIVVALDFKRTQRPFGNVLDAKCIEPKIADAKRGVFAGLVSSVNCRKRTPFRLDDDGPPQLVSRDLPFQSNFHLRANEEAELLQDNDSVEICCVLAVIIAAWDGFFMFESPADRGDETRPDLYVAKWWDHAPMHLLECFQHLMRLCDVVTLWFHLACFGSDFLGPTDFHVSANISTHLHGLTSRRTMRRDQPKKAAGWVDGELHSGLKARFPTKLNQFISKGVTAWLAAAGWCVQPAVVPVARSTQSLAVVESVARGHFTTLTSVRADAVCLVPLRYDAGVYEFGTIDGDFIGSQLLEGDGSIGTRSESAAGVLASSISFDKGLLFGCGTLASQSSGHACHVYVAPAVEGWTPPPEIVFLPSKAIHGSLPFEVCGVITKTVSRSGYGHGGDQMTIGNWNGARRVVVNPSGRKYATAAASCTAQSEWSSCLERDAQVCAGLRRSLEGSTSRVKQVRDMAMQVKGIADFQQELPIPLQGLPRFGESVFASCVIPDRLPPPSTKWLHSIPPQRDVFGGNKPTWWCTTADHVGVLSNDGGTCFIDFVHSMRDWCFACLDGSGNPGGVRGPRTTVLGDGLFEKISLADGSGVAPACINIWECTAEGVRLFDWSAGFNSQFNADDLIQWLGQGDDMRTLSILANGTLFLHPDADTPPPHHVRLMPNQSSYGEAIEPMGEEITEMAEKGHYAILDVCGRDDLLTHEGPPPTSHLPSWNSPILGVDKPNGKKRRCMNKSAPHPDRDGEPVRERHKLHGRADGAEVLPHNHLTGCASFLPLWARSCPPEDKTSHNIMCEALVRLLHVCAVANAHCVGVKLDYAQFFWQFEKNPYEHWFSKYWAVVQREHSREKTPRLCEVTSHVMEMGDNPSSGTGQAFSNAYDARLADTFDPISDKILLSESQVLQDEVARVRSLYGYKAGRLFHISTFTDDQCSYAVNGCTKCVRATALVEHEFETAERFRIILAPPVKLEVGTVTHPLGARYVLTAGLSYVTPDKHRRAAQGCVDALQGRSTRDEYESHCGLAGHIGQQHFFPPGTFNGMQRPLHSQLALSGGNIVLTAAATAANEYLLQHLRTRPFASFTEVIRGPDIGAFYAEGVSPPPCITTDACTGEDAPSPGVGVWMEGLWCRWAISRFWQAFHITLLEYVGQRIGELRMAPYVRHEPAVLRNSDNMAACVAQVKGSKSTAIDAAHRYSKTIATLVDLDMRSFQNHMAGRLLWFADAISRDKLVELDSVCHTLHLRHKNVGLNEEVRDFIGGLEVHMLFVSAELRMALPSPANSSSGKVVRFATDVDRRRRKSTADAYGSFIIVNGDDPTFRSQQSDVWIDRTHDTLGNFLPMKGASMRDAVCDGFDDVWHGRATVEQAAQAIGVAPSGMTAHASVRQRHNAADAIARRVIDGEHVRGVCHCVPKRCHGLTILGHVESAVAAARRSTRPKRARTGAHVVEGVAGVVHSNSNTHSGQAERLQTKASSRPVHARYGGEADEVISHFEAAGLGGALRLLVIISAASVIVVRKRRRWRGIVARATAIARLLLGRGMFGMAATVSAATRGHLPSHQQQYNMPVRPPTVQVWTLQRYPYLQNGYLTDMRYGERMVQETFYQFPAALDNGEFRSRNDMVHELFKATAFGDRGVKFAYWYDHGTISAPMPTTYDQLHRWIMAGDFSQAFYINDDSLETPEKLDEEAAAEARMDDLLNAPSGANCDYCGTWCAHGEYDEDWRGTGLSVCYAGEHEAEKAESEAHFYGMSPVSPRHWIWSSEDSKHDDEDDDTFGCLRDPGCVAYDSKIEVVRFPPPTPRVPRPSPLISGVADSVRARPIATSSRSPPASPSPLIAAPPPQCARQPRRLVASPLITAGAGPSFTPTVEDTSTQQPSRLFVPQPRLTVAQARGKRNVRLAETLIADESPYALFQGAPALAVATLEAIGDSTSSGTKHGTRSRQDWALTWWQRACETLRTPWWRDDTAGFSYDTAERAAFVEREHVLVKAVVLTLAREVRNNVDKSLSAKPGTIRAIISTARSTLVNDLACPPVPPHPMREIFSNITSSYVKRHGQIALLRKKKKVIPRDVSIAMLSVSGMIGRYLVDWSSTMWVMIGAAYVTCLNTGLRKCSISTAHPDDLYAVLANIAWFIDGDWRTEPTIEQLKTVRDGDLMRFMPPMGDKTDAYGQNFGHEYMYFRVDSSDPLSCAHWLLRRELVAPPAGRRDATPLFSPDGGSTAFAASFLDCILQQWLTVVVGPKKAAEHSWHACRATLASSLGLMKESGEVIQVFCRWRAAESVREYNHVTPDVYADKVAAAMAVNAAQAPKGQKHVVTDDDDAMAVLQAELDDLTVSNSSAAASPMPTTRARAETKDTPAAPATAVYQRVTKPPVKGNVLLVPASTWPTETCLEGDGQGWLAKVVAVHGEAVSLCFEAARTNDGRPYENVRLEWRHLQRNVTG